MERDVIATMITGSMDSQALVRRTRDPSELEIQGMHTSDAGHSQLRSESNMSQQEQLHQLQQQIQQLQLQMQQMQQQMEKTQHSQQNIQGQVDEIPQNFGRMDRLIQQSQQQQMDRIIQMEQQMDQRQLQVQQLQQQMEKTQHSQQHIQCQMDEIPQNFERMELIQQSQQQQMDRIIQMEQRMDQRLQQMDDAMQTIQQQDPLTPDQRQEETMQVLDHFAHVQYHIQDILHRSYQSSPIPRLFILLPEPEVTMDGRGTTTPSLHFRLHFLCQCGAHTQAKDFIEPHEIHLTEHHGYTLAKQDEFIRKYGWYILGMMYMVKYGAKTEGLVVPPLLGLHHAIVPASGQEHLQFFMKNIGRLVDDTITRLEEAFGVVRSDTNTAAHQKLGYGQLNQVRQYLTIKWKDRGVKGGKDVFVGDLSRTMTLDGRCVWVCSKHKLRKVDELTEQPMIDPQAIKDSDPLGIKAGCVNRTMGMGEMPPYVPLTREGIDMTFKAMRKSGAGHWIRCPNGHTVSFLGSADSFVIIHRLKRMPCTMSLTCWLNHS